MPIVHVLRQLLAGLGPTTGPQWLPHPNHVTVTMLATPIADSVQPYQAPIPDQSCTARTAAVGYQIGYVPPQLPVGLQSATQVRPGQDARFLAHISAPAV